MQLQTYGFMDDTIKDYIEYYIHMSPWKNAILQAPEAVPIWTDQYISMKEYYRTEFYNDLMQREGGADSASGMNIIKGKDRLAIMAVHFDNKRSETLHRKASYFLSNLHHDLKKAFNFNKLLNGEAVHTPQSGDFSLANIKLPAFIINGSSQVISINQALVELMSKYDFLQINVLNKLCFSDIEVHNIFTLKLSNISKNILLSTDSEHSDMKVTYDNLIFRFSFLPLDHHYNITDFNGMPTHKASVTTFMVVISAHKTRNIEDDLADLLGKNYGLTKAEIKIIILISEGNTLQAISEISNTSIHTVRTQLKSIFQKTNIRRQQELVSLVHLMRQKIGI